jgi:nucleotide-binding universal stress UspA family protein
MYEKILLPLDGSTLSESALPYARLLATALRVPVELLQAMDPDLLAVLGHPRYVEREPSLEAIVKERQLRYLTTVERLFPAPVRVSGAVEVGSAEELILATARTAPNTLVVMATHGHLRLYDARADSQRQLSPTSINWRKVTRAQMRRYAIKQDPGVWNALGKLKFVFPNSYTCTFMIPQRLSCLRNRNVCSATVVFA